MSVSFDADHVSAAFRRFSAKECPGQSPLYEVLARQVADDRALLQLADLARAGQPRPNMLFAAVHALLLRGMADNELAPFYPDIAARPRDPLDAFPGFKAFCLAQEDAIAALLRRRVVSTNEVLRATCLRLAYAEAARRLGRFHLIEIGASAGLNLIWDRYGYDYGTGDVVGPSEAALVLATEFRGTGKPDPDAIAAVPLSCCGIDPDPLNARNPDDHAWLRALVWPEQAERAERLALALDLVAADPPRLIEGRANECLPQLLQTLPPGEAVCVSHAFTLNQFSADDRAAFETLLLRSAEMRPLARVAMEWGDGAAPELCLAHYDTGNAPPRRLARCDAHGAWIHWEAG